MSRLAKGKRLLGKDFLRRAKEHILISANNLTVCLYIFLWFKLKCSTTVNIWKILWHIWYVTCKKINMP